MKNSKKSALILAASLIIFLVLVAIFRILGISASYISSAVILAGLVDGINPCAISVMLFLLGYLVIFAEKSKRVLTIGLVYITTVYLVYFGVGIFFYSSVKFLNSIAYHYIFHFVFAGLVIGAGLLNLKDFFFPGSGFSLKIPVKTQPLIASFVEKASISATIVLAVLVTLCEIPCSLPLYAGTINILAGFSLLELKVLGYFFVYNLMFVFPLILILVLVYSGEKIMVLKEWEHRNKKWLKMIIGTALVLTGTWIIIKG